MLAAHDAPNFPEPGNAHSERKRPRGFVPHRHGPVCGGWDEWDEVFHRNMGPLQPEGFPRRILEDKAVGLQISVLLQHADPVFVAVAGHGHQLFGKRPTIEQEYTQWYFVPYRGLQQVHAEIDLRTKLRVQLLKVRVFSQDGVDCLVEPRPVFLRGGHGAVGKVCVDKGFPLGEFFIAPIQAEVQRKAPGAADIMTRDRMVGERIRVVAMMIMAIHIGEQTAHRLTQGSIEDQHCVGLRSADRLRLLEQIRDPTVIDVGLEPGRFRAEAGEIGFVRTLEYTAGHIGQAVVIQNDQARQIMLEMVKLAPILAEVPKDVRVSDYEGSGSHDGKLHET